MVKPDSSRETPRILLPEADVRQALLIRRVEERLLELFARGVLTGTIHACTGQELSAVAFGRQIGPDDIVFSNHRCHGHFIACTGNVEGLIAELMGKAAGVCGGVGSSQHLCQDRFHSNGVQGGIAPVAAGMALAKKLRGESGIGVVFIGDGTLGEGVLYETMNLVSLHDIPLLFVCENNFYAQSTPQALFLAGDIRKRAEAFGIRTFGSTTQQPELLLTDAFAAVDFVRKNRRPAFHVVETCRLAPHSKGDDTRTAAEIETLRQRDPLVRFAQHNPDAYQQWQSEVDLRIAEIVDRQTSAREMSIDEYDPRPEAPPANVWRPLEAPEVRQIDRINQVFDQWMAKDHDIVFLGEDVLSPYGGAFKAARGLSDKYSDRVLTTPISEAGITGLANGLALAGMRPVLEIMFGDFITLCMDQLVNHASKFHHMYNGKVRCPLILRTPMGGRRGYGPTHSQTLDKLLLGIDNVTVLALNPLVDPSELYGTVFAKVAHPVVVIENKTDYARRMGKRALAQYLYERGSRDFPTARIRPRQSVPTVTIVTYGGMTEIVLDAVPEIFRETELKPEVLVLSKISPIDDLDLIVASVSQTRRLVVVEEGSVFGGVGGEILAAVLERMTLPFRARRVGARGVPIPSARALEAAVLPGASAIVEAVRETLP